MTEGNRKPENTGTMNALTTIEAGAIQRQAVAEDVITRYLASLDVKPRSRETYRAALKHFTGWIIERGKAATDRTDILAYKAHLQAKYRKSTFGAYFTAVKGLYTYLEAEKLYPNIAAGVKGPRNRKSGRKTCLSKEQAVNLLGSMAGSGTDQLRDYAIVNLLVRTGLRTIEIQRANIEDIQQEDGAAVLYIQGKGCDAKDAFVVLTESTLQPIRAYIEARGQVQGDAPLFVAHSNRNQNGRMTTRSISRLIKSALRGSGIDSERITAHSLRHTAVTLALLAGASVQEAQRMARHSDINTTLIYAHNIDRIGKAPERRIDAFLSA